ncbi:lpg2382 family Dot/Icm T4SS effector [Legionella pneumophila]|uniref:lpg2382 family Dot/Icm T4SS effector n=1 Tax=Legionella pneumophila TaxID=446 RepID=UPI00077712FD|nr:lpg2382 family Dot/Icm T4SS effector [Legionella pneumophila]HAT8666462.1 lpg2382 family Dot/Icm T4SS effector [Legionella pneumophila]
MENKTMALNFLNRIERCLVPQSNPQIMKQLLSALGLDKLTTGNEEYKLFIQTIKKKSIDLNPLISKVKSDILNNDPLWTLLAYIEENELIDDAEIENASSTIQLQVNLLCLLEAITITMANSNDFAHDIYNHMMKQRGKGATGNPFYNFLFGIPSRATLFERLKLISIDPGLTSIIFHRLMGANPETQADLDDFVSQNRLSGWNADIELANFDVASTSTLPAMGVNILEAVWEDATGHNKNTGGILNAQAGLGLIGVMEEQEYTTSFKLTETTLPQGTTLHSDLGYSLIPELKVDNSPKKVSQFHIDKRWMNLYNSWNLCFVIANIDPVFVPLKLLIPSVFSAEPSNYKETRVLTLFLVANLFLNQQTLNNPLFSNNFSFRNGAAIMKKWGEINKNHASELLQQCCAKEYKEPDTLYNSILGEHPHLNFVLKLLSYFQDSHQFRLTKKAQPSTLSDYSFFSGNAASADNSEQLNLASQPSLNKV